MFDGHALPLAETALIARVAHAFNAAVEEKLGAFGEGQGSHEFTNPQGVPLLFEQGQIVRTKFQRKNEVSVKQNAAEFSGDSGSSPVSG